MTVSSGAKRHAIDRPDGAANRQQTDGRSASATRTRQDVDDVEMETDDQHQQRGRARTCVDVEMKMDAHVISNKDAQDSDDHD